VGNRLLHPSQDGRDLNRISNEIPFSRRHADKANRPERAELKLARPFALPKFPAWSFWALS
jgi:hypothetical protein